MQAWPKVRRTGRGLKVVEEMRGGWMKISKINENTVRSKTETSTIVERIQWYNDTIYWNRTENTCSTKIISTETS